MSEPRPPGKIITFYSYKGGTGRTMALANVAWILASNGKRVLVIDWDLEAPGLHRYFHPFLDDKEAAETPGLIDYFVDVEMASRREAPDPKVPWWHEWCSLSRYTTSIDWEFSSGGFLDFISAGQQGPTYAERVSAFDWRRFYDDLGGGVLLESLKSRLRADYDFILIDSRTGISDTSGICTVQMPDELVVCFTLNQQSMKGAAAAAHSAWNQRKRPNGEPGLKVWPVPTRIELAEKDRLDTARDAARKTFDWFIGHLGRSIRESYWSNAEVMYQPFFAYDEILAAFAERRAGAGSVILTMGLLAQRLAPELDIRLPKLEENIRLQIYRKFVPDPTSPAEADQGPLTYISYPGAHEATARMLARDLKAHGARVYLDLDEVGLGEDINDAAKAGISRASTVLALFGDKPGRSSQTFELVTARDVGKRVIPAIIGNATFDDVPAEFQRYRGVDLRMSNYETNMATLADALKTGPRGRAVPPNTDDPQKGRWGGSTSANGRLLSAMATEISPSWYQLELVVESSFGARLLEGEVEFHLHPTFPSSVMKRTAAAGRATLSIGAWGAFTVGAVCDRGATTLELDLAQVASLPQAFREK